MAFSTSQNVPYLPRGEIEKQARAVLRHHGLESIPINPVVIAQKAGFQVNNAKFSDDSISGMIAKRGEASTILVRAEDSPNRKRFTIAHELAHHFLHLSGEGEFIDGDADLLRTDFVDTPEAPPSTERLEYQANQFAAALLMPEEFVRAYWQKELSPAELGKLFGVSEEAMSIRLKTLGLRPYA